MAKDEMMRLFIALLLSMAVIYVWNSFFYEPPAKVSNQDLNPEQQGDISSQVNKASTQQVSSGNLSVNEEVTKSKEEIISESISKALRIKISNDRIHGSINLKGAILDDITLANYREELSNDSPEVTLFSPTKGYGIYIARTGWVATDKNITVPDTNTVWQTNSLEALTQENPITLYWDSPQNIRFVKNISIDDKFMIIVEDSIINNSEKSIDVAPFAYINRARDLEQNGNHYQYISHEGPIVVADQILHEIDYDEIAEEQQFEFRNVKGWAGITDKYWLTSIIPELANEDKFNITVKYYRKNKIDRFQVDIIGGIISIASKEQKKNIFEIFAGAKKLKFLDSYQESLNIPLFDRAIDFGFLYFLTRPIFEALTFFNKLFGNFGYAILALTVLIKLILFPLANKSYRSMARMRKHMPEIQKMKERFKDDRQKLGVEMMKYYKDHRINPMSGCLPIFVQIPVFFSLYKVLVVTIEMRHAPFIGFIEDLSAKDPTNILTLFGLIPWVPPSWLPAIGILPLLFSLTMFLQQKLNPPPTDETQRIVMNWLPWIFLFVFASFPAGLVIYWVWNNILSIIQQYVITKRIEADKNE